MSEKYFIPLVQKSEYLNESENNALINFYHLCCSVAELETQNEKKTHIRKSVLRLLQKTLNEKADVLKLDCLQD